MHQSILYISNLKCFENCHNFTKLFWFIFSLYVSFFQVANRKPFLGAVKLFDDLTCIKWKPRSSEVKAEVGHDGYVRVKR